MQQNLRSSFVYFHVSSATSGPPCLCSDPLSLPQFFHFLSLSFFPTKSRDPPHFTSLPRSLLVPPMFSNFLTALLFSLMFPLEPSFTLSPWCPACCCAPWARSASCWGWRGAPWVSISHLPSPGWQLKEATLEYILCTLSV